jgi:hypothetical protein
VQVTTALGTLSLDTVKPDQLLVPTTQSALGQPDVVDPQHVDRYKCYQVRITKKTAKVPRDQQLVVQDSLASLVRRFQVKQPTRLCLAADETPDTVKNQNGHLLCYPVKPVKGQPKNAKQPGIYLSNDLVFTRLDAVRPSELCIPAVLE